MTDKNEEDERTTDVGLFHYANSFRKSAKALNKAKVKATHPDAPVCFLFYHSIELYMKAYLRHSGYSVNELRGLSHGFVKLGKAFEAKGGVLDDEDREILELLDETGSFIRARYIRTGAFTRPAEEALSRTTKSLHESVREKLKSAGKPVR